ncbi:MAG: CerR family C-terminal domain-containing protein [Pseudomonadota bacterium]|nr:CerR family C-terminal domain-containing protein [Pseudomonadota bacterium]
MTHERLLDIAIREFGLKGLEGASTRGIAAAAGTAMSSITYHYGSKEALYLAAADHIAAAMAEEMLPALALCDPADWCNAAGARVGIHAIIARLAAKMASDSSANWSLFILREQMNPSEAFDRIYAGMMEQVMTRIADLTAIVTGCSPRVARIATVTMLGQVLAIRASRASILRLLSIPALDASHADALAKQIHANTDAILDRMTAQEPQ